jgi:FkbM family methyltransferase
MIVAVEPDSGNLRVCRKNIAAIGASTRIGLIQGFIGPAEGIAGIDRSGGEWSFKVASPVGSNDVVPVLTMGMLLVGQKIEHVDLLKVDIEGGEAALFSNCAEWIHRVRAIIVETEPPYSIALLQADLRKNGANFDVEWQAIHDGRHHIALLRNSNE